MDDPWGSSPWADEVQLPDSVKTKAAAPRPTTPVRAPKLGLDKTITSPWGGDDNDDDGFGDWATLPEDSRQTLGLDGTSHGWGEHSADIGDVADGHAQGLSTDWNAHPAMDNERPSILAPSPFPRAAELMRQPSPDPWALEIEEAEAKEEPKQVAEELGEDTVHKAIMLEDEMAGSPEPQILQPSNESLVPDLRSETEETATVGTDIPSDAKGRDLRPKDNATKISEAKPGPESQDSDPVSRPSSSPSERSHHDELPQESPRTSFDEEPKSNRPEVARKVSTKVQELVQHFDTLAKKEVVEPITTRTNSAQGTALQEDSEVEDDDFGDFEEGQSDDERSEAEDARAPDQTLSQSPINKTSQHQRTPSLEDALTKDYGVVEFKFDLSKLDGLYPSDTPDPTSETIFIPDSIPFDSFSSTEQRKTWYRISRYGTMRKHNSGNDENYVRVGWKPSTIRDDTLKIVSRWIEEDRISGRVVLGGGSKGSTVFGWNDPRAPTVPLSDVFVKHGKKMTNSNTAIEAVPEVPREWPKGLVRDRSTSKTRSPSSKPRRKSSVKAATVPVSSDIKNSPVAPVANFGWNSASGVAQKSNDSSLSSQKRTSASHPDLAPPPRELLSYNRSHTTTFPTSQNAASQSPTLPAALATEPPVPFAQKSVPPSLSMSNAVNDDDDWGEMVSTPATPTLPVLPSSKGLRHKKSQSFGGVATDPSKREMSSGWTNGHRETTHQSTASVDEFLAPQQPASAPNSLPITSGVDPFPPPVDSFQTSVAASTPDPWASADFSFFETAPAPAPAPVPKPVPKPTQRTIGPKSVKFNAPIRHSTRGDQKSRDELEQDRIVQSVVKGLPDLSYMLRK
ncbi:hypothetical protein BKA64DRAFT_689627 [Cadophora sp. MPI-SDFR-AT-0126]|nr:hypothetical protein BKA64DRAFT_689627 [Leotiomycetes sp. MPI-SDFR-AT-0126]